MSENPRAEHLRNAIDRGQTSGKVSHPDAAAAPLGTDEEAAGTPVPPVAVETALQDEVRNPPRSPREGPEPAFWPGAAWIAAAGILLAGVLWLALA
jgi:hypothetical protein